MCSLLPMAFIPQSLYSEGIGLSVRIFQTKLGFISQAILICKFSHLAFQKSTQVSSYIVAPIKDQCMEHHKPISNYQTGFFTATVTAKHTVIFSKTECLPTQCNQQWLC